MKNLDVRWVAALGGLLSLPQAVHLALSGRTGFDGVTSGFVLGFCTAFVAFAVTRERRQVSAD
jgi:hypothetical protein